MRYSRHIGKSNQATWVYMCGFFFQAEDGIRDLVRSRGLGDVYKRQVTHLVRCSICSEYFDPKTGEIANDEFKYPDFELNLSLIHI